MEDKVRRQIKFQAQSIGKLLITNRSGN